MTKVYDTDTTFTDRLDAIEEALTEVDHAWHLFTHAKTPLDQANALVKLSDAMHDLKTWHRGFDINDGMLPWEREED